MKETLGSFSVADFTDNNGITGADGFDGRDKTGYPEAGWAEVLREIETAN